MPAPPRLHRWRSKIGARPSFPPALHDSVTNLLHLLLDLITFIEPEPSAKSHRLPRFAVGENRIGMHARHNRVAPHPAAALPGR